MGGKLTGPFSIFSNKAFSFYYLCIISGSYWWEMFLKHLDGITLPLSQCLLYSTVTEIEMNSLPF